jgi:protein O-GlcNAc transferase
MSHHRAGQLKPAEDLYRQVLGIQPDHADALHLLGVIAHQKGEHGQAIELIDRAIALQPSAAMYGNLAQAVKARGDLEGAIRLFRHALSLDPQHADTYNNLGVALSDQSKFPEAMECFIQAISLRPDYSSAYCNLGVAAFSLGHLDEAIRCYQAAISIDPNYAVAYNNLGNVLREQGKYDAAIEHFTRALEISHEYALAHSNLGNTLRDRHNHEAAVHSYEQALAHDPTYTPGYSNLGNALRDQGHPELAVELYRKALALDPGLNDIHSNLLLTLLTIPNDNLEEHFAEHLRFAERFETPHKASWPAHANPRDKDKRLKVGYVSGDFRNHSIAFFFEPVLLGHDKSQVEVFCYHNHHQHDDVSSRLAALADHWIACKGMADEALAARIRADGIDILVDLSGHTAYNRLLTFARKPAPVQITWMGYPNSTGLSAIDYRLTDAAMDPPGLTERYNSETLLRLPTSCQFNPSPIRPPINALPALTQGVFTFACLNHLTKISEQAMALWAQILQALPDARLMLGGVNDQASRQKLIDTFARYGIAEDRLALHPKMSLDAFLALHHQIDLALDPFPFNGGTTSFHALSMGVPVVTLAGDTPVTRSGASIMANVGLPEFVATSPEEYVRLAIGFAGDVPRLDRIRQSLGAGNPALYEPGTNPFARHLEQAFRQVWTTWCDKYDSGHSRTNDMTQREQAKGTSA